MHLLHLLCPREKTFALAQQFEELFRDQEALSVAASGLVVSQPVGFVVLTSETPFDEEFLTEINQRPDISGYSPFTLNDDDVFGTFGSELVAPW
jgi:hypothetical protein